MTSTINEQQRVSAIPKDKEEWLSWRAENLSSTEIPALFGLSPYMTEFELYQRKKNKVSVDIVESGRMKWGTRLQATIAHGIAEDHGWNIRPMPEYISIPELKLGSSFDFMIDDNGILEIKNVDGLVYKNEWLDDEAPPHIELQLQHQLLVSGKSLAYIGALVGGNEVVLLKREPNEKIFSQILEKAAAFWARTSPPEIDFKRDAEFLSRLYKASRPNEGQILNAEDDEELRDLAKTYKKHGDEIKDLEAKQEEAKAKMMMKVGSCSKVLGGNYSISASVIEEKEISYLRKSYRDFRLHWKKAKS